jgi:predicted RNA-binding protein with PUA-like domain
MTKYWLLKTEPDVFSIQDLESSPQKTTSWEGVRNYQARNFLRDDMAVGDGVLIYHSGGTNPCVAGTARIVRAGYPDPYAWDQNSHYFDPDSKPDNPRWFMVDVQWQQTFAQPVTLAKLRTLPKLAEMDLLRKGNRLSVQPVKKMEFDQILKLGLNSIE